MQATLDAVLAIAASSLPEHGQSFALAQAGVAAAQATLAAARATLAAVEQARAAERANELALWQQGVSSYLRLPLNHAR
jgi:hypothetical protein